ncbi:phosphomannomutase/phosphoglucomutase [Candidatus Saccharibacteria bacterium]|nr:MAG: phosphomannomutase/phosphoglucomutase [Candidatus Saccharibacteria bacterium]
MGNIAGIFKAYDIRGAVGTELNEAVAKGIGKALADILGPGKVAVGRDMRPDSGALADAVIAGLTEQGRDIIDIGQVTSDMIYFAVGSMGLAGGAMITASHNPGKDNGIKLCREQAKPIGHESGLFDIRDAVMQDSYADPAPQRGSVEQKTIDEAWIQHVLSFVDADKLKPMHIAVDAGNGMAGKIVPQLAPRVPWKIEEMYFELDGTFPNHEANPLKFETLADMIDLIKEKGLDGGAAFDGDGDRAFLVDETGTVLTGGVMSAMMADYFLQQHPGAKIVYDVRNSRTVPHVVASGGGTPLLERVGHANIKRRMLEEDAVFGGEASGHFFFRDNWYADSGLIGAVIGLYVAGLSGKKLSELREQYTHFAAIPEINFVVEEKDEAIDRLSQAFGEYKQSRLDGLTVELGNDTWFNVRPSNTEPVMRLNAESSDQATLDDLVEKVKQLIAGE